MPEIGSAKAVTDKAKTALSKQAPVGENIDLNKYSHSTDELPYQYDPSQLPVETKQRMIDVGVTMDDNSQRSGTIIQIDHSIVHSLAMQEGIEVMGTNQALEKYDWLSDYFWKAVAVDTDKYTAHVELNQSNG
ncbi:MAG: SufD family Fe-S cluster assembly protein, partial [Dehalococcoidia bacterium]|nr:SufD family Fe-S cluster assembly protein [Dehalococcoidia bacterium]